MDLKGTGVKWISRIAIGSGIGGFLLIWFPFVCYIAPILSQVGILLGLIGYLRFSKEEDNQNKLISLIGMIAGFAGLFVFMLMFILDWSLWG